MFTYDPYANYEKIEFGNGLNAYVLYEPGRPFVHVSAMVHSGFWHDPDGLVGLSHFTEHMVDANGGMNEMQLRKFFESEGGEYRLFTDAFDTEYGFTAPLDDVVPRKFMTWLSHLCFEIEFHRYLKRERRIISSEHKRRVKIAALRELIERKQRSLFIGTPLARSLSALGNLEGIQAIQMSDIRDFYARAYVPGNISLIVTGGLSATEFVKLLQDFPFVSSAAGCGGRRLFDILHRPEVPKETRFEFSVTPGQDTQCDYALEVMVPGTIKREALGVFKRMCDLLLFSELRERRQLAYSVGADSQYWRSFSGLGISITDFDVAKLRDVETGVRLVLGNFPKQKRRFMAAKHFATMSFRVQDLKLRQIHQNVRSMLAREGRIRTDAEDLAAVEAVGFDDVCQLAEMLLGNRAVTTVIRS